ncbi:MAG: lysophospholipid acyltransferase family protein [candidate division WOR-3 bacterium]
MAWLATYPLAKLLFRLRVFGREVLGPGPQILASNHLSNVDPLIVGWAAARELHFLAKEELFRASRLFDWLIRAWNAWPVRRGVPDPAAIRHCTEVLQRGQTLVLFPEGTRSRTGEMAEFKPGVGMLAINAMVPVVPTRISGLDQSWISYLADRDFVIRGFRHKPAQNPWIEVRFGEPVHPADFRRSREGYVEMTRVIEARVRELVK